MFAINNNKMREWKLNAVEGFLMAVFSEIQKYGAACTEYDKEIYQILDRQTILKELPTLKSTSAVKRGILGLERKGIIKSISIPDTDYTYTAYLLTEKGCGWNDHEMVN